MRSALFATLASLAAINGIHAHPTAQSSRSLGRRAIDLDAFRMKMNTEYKNATEVKTDPTIPTLRARASTEETATELVETTVPGATFRLSGDHYVGDNGIAHFYFKQTANGLDIDNADFNVNIGRDGKVFSFGNSFYKGDIPSLPALGKRDTTDPADALRSAVNLLDLPMSADSVKAEPKAEAETFAIKSTSGSLKEPEARLVYIQDADGSLKLTWRVETDIGSNWLLSYVDAISGDKVHAVVDYSADDSYQVYPWGINDPTEGQRITVEDPFGSYSSEFGWHSDGTDWYKTTRGNNAVAQTNWEGKLSDYLSLPRPTSRLLEFRYPYSLNETDYKVYANASITQLFYTANKYHDLLHDLGFIERAGNFEMNNNNAGGVGNDFVYLNAQDGAGFNNANFATPPDGQAPRMRMYIWNRSTPFRDGSFDAGVVIHEYTHGLSNRLTGGPRNSGCLNRIESGGMGEGWSDFYATAIRLKANDTRKTNYAIGAWASNKEVGIRNYLYSTSMSTNPQTYSSVELYNAVHPIGNIWASMLYEVLWNLIDKYGKNDGDTPEFGNYGIPTDGKYLAMKLVMDGMSLQPCNPNFVQARDAILDADWALTGGVNACEIWTAFAKRGLGEGARYQETGRTESFKVPNDAC